MNYPCIIRTDETADAEILLEEFKSVCSHDLTSAYAGQTAWRGVRIFDLTGVDRTAELPHLGALLDRLGRENVVMINYYNLAPQSQQREHRDQSGNLLFGISRIHVALKTNPGVRLRIERKDYHMALGEVWAIDTSGRHSAINNGEEERIHLVIDVTRGQKTERFFPRTTIAVRLHLAKFSIIIGWKLVRDTFLNPGSVIDRIRYMTRFFLRKVGSRKPS